jgi:small nuclear ribonucleoprotein (snRNP)-like protein
MSRPLDKVGDGASVIAFFTIFETLRAIWFTREFITGVQQAPDELRGLIVQLRFFQLSFALFLDSVSAAVKSGYLEAFDNQTKLALDDARQIMQEFEEFIEKHGQGRATSTWTAIQIATKRKHLTKLSKRLTSASFQIHFSHSSLVS